jgi:hypothetical protein
MTNERKMPRLQHPQNDSFPTHGSGLPSPSSWVPIVLLLAASATVARADYLIVQGRVERTTSASCSAGLVLETNGTTTCLDPKKFRKSLESKEGELLKLGVALHKKHKIDFYEVKRVDPPGQIGEWKLSGLNGFLVAASPIMEGVALGLSGQVPADPNPPAYTPPPYPVSTSNAPQPPTAPSTTSSRVQSLGHCVGTQYESGTLWLVNSCGVAVYVEVTSDSGSAWGAADVGPSSRAAFSVMGMGYDPKRDGRVWTFVCPQGSVAKMPDGNGWLPHNYKGSFFCSVQ